MAPPADAQPTVHAADLVAALGIPGVDVTQDDVLRLNREPARQGEHRLAADGMEVRVTTALLGERALTSLMEAAVTMRSIPEGEPIRSTAMTGMILLRLSSAVSEAILMEAMIKIHYGSRETAA